MQRIGGVADEQATSCPEGMRANSLQGNGEACTRGFDHAEAISKAILQRSPELVVSERIYSGSPIGIQRPHTGITPAAQRQQCQRTLRCKTFIGGFALRAIDFDITDYDRLAVIDNLVIDAQRAARMGIRTIGNQGQVRL